jgi:ABC-2 type transport system permease protein
MRQARNLMREPIWIVMMVLQPMIWLILYGQLFKNVTRLGGFGTGSYITFLVPAIVIMNSFFGATWSGMSLIQDLEHKVVERFLATPASRVAIILSYIVRSSITAVLQSILILLIGLAFGVHIGAAGWLVIMVSAILVNSVFSGFSQAIALLTRREATMIAVANSLTMPLLFLSTTLIALAQMPHWMRVGARYNPVNWAVDSAREASLPGTSWSSVGWHLLWLLLLSAVMTAWATRTFRAYQRSL